MSNSHDIARLAKVGVEYGQQIDQMLMELWHEFKALEPDYAAMFEKTLGSEKLAALVISGRRDDQPSFLEELAQESISPEEVENFLKLGPSFVSQIKTGLQESERGETTEYSFNTSEALSEAAHRARTNYEFELVDIFKQLKAKDPEVASAVLALLEDQIKAAEFMTMPACGLAGKSPLQAIEDGERQTLLDLVGRLEHGSIP